MHYTPITPFRRPVAAAHIAQLGRVHDTSSAGYTHKPANKWELLKQLSTAKRIYGLTDRDLSVLQALLSFHPEVLLGQSNKPLVVYPSNMTICERLNGMPCSTMRRHLAKLIEAGLLIRRDSPNGKRYSRSFMGEKICFGFDLTPLLARQGEFQEAAANALAQEEALHRQRETLSLMRRDLFSLIAFGRENAIHGDWDSYHDLAVESGNHLKRRLSHEMLAEWISRINTALQAIKASLLVPVSEEMSTKVAQNEQHYQSTIEESDSCNETCKQPASQQDVEQLPVETVLETLGEIQSFASAKIRDWRSFVATTETIRPMMGLSQASWNSAVATLGVVKAAIAVAAMLERIGDIQSPSAYLTKLCTDANAKTLGLRQWISGISGRYRSAPALSSQL